MSGKAAKRDERRVADLSLQDLEALVEERRRIERARAFAEEDARRFHPFTVQPTAAKTKRRGKRGLRDGVLLFIELGAVAGLLGIIALAFGNLSALNAELAAAIRNEPASAAQAPVQNVAGNALVPLQAELPGGSFPPSSAGELPGSSFPPEALPASIGVRVEQAPPLPPPTLGLASPTRLVIPALGIDWPIVAGDGWEELKRGVGHHASSANPGERGNMVLSGHNDVFGEVFKDLEALKNGDEVQVFAGGRMYKYQVRAKRIVSPNELSVIQPTREAVVTLITCHPYRVDTHRLVVIAQLVP